MSSSCLHVAKERGNGSQPQPLLTFLDSCVRVHAGKMSDGNRSLQVMKAGREEREQEQQIWQRNGKCMADR